MKTIQILMLLLLMSCQKSNGLKVSIGCKEKEIDLVPVEDRPSAEEAFPTIPKRRVIEDVVAVVDDPYELPDSLIVFKFNIVLLISDTDFIEKEDGAKLIYEQLVWMNDEYNKYGVGFELAKDMIWQAHEDYKLDDMVQSFKQRDTKFERVAEDYLDPCAIDVFVFDESDTYYGWTPVLQKNWHNYEVFSPELDRIVASVDGMRRGSTIFHEFLHFTGSSDDMNDLDEEELKHYGIDGFQGKCRNIMNSACYTDLVTDMQIKTSVANLLEYRSYLLCE